MGTTICKELGAVLPLPLNDVESQIYFDSLSSGNTRTLLDFGGFYDLMTNDYLYYRSNSDKSILYGSLTYESLTYAPWSLSSQPDSQSSSS